MKNFVSLGELCNKITDGTHHTPTYVETGVPFLRVTDITGSNDSKKFISQSEHLELIKRCNPQKGDILYTKNGTIGVAKKIIWDYDFSIFVSLCLLKPKTEIVLVDYLVHYLNTKMALNQALSHTKTGTISNLHLIEIKKIQIPLPSLPQQQKIANILDAADELRQNDKKLIAKYDELTQALFLDMFGDPVSNPKGWEEKRLGVITNMKAGKFIAASDIFSENNNYMFPCYGGNGLRGFSETHTHEGEFVLIGRQGALCGNVRVANGKFHATEHAIVCFPISKYQTLWLYYLLKMMNLNRFATGAAQPGLNVSTLVDLEIMIVPYEFQNQFAERVKLIEEQKAIAQKSLEKSEDLFNSLLQKEFKS